MGLVGASFRPLHDKSRQDFGLAWETGNDTLGLQTQARFTIEDTFNNLWEFRQTRVGNPCQPYLRHPYEPALRLVHRDPRWRAELAGRWLTPSRRQVIADPVLGTYRSPTLWGAHGEASLEADAFAARWRVAGDVRQTARREDGAAPPGAAGDGWRRRWRAEVGVVTRAVPPTRVELGGVDVPRRQHAHPPLAPYRFDASLTTW